MTIILNLKNYPEVLGEGSVRLAKAAKAAALSAGVEVIVAPPAAMVGLVASSVQIPVFSQNVGTGVPGASTGATIPEALEASGAKGSILNHSESPVPVRDLTALVPRLRGLSLSSCVCAGTTPQAVSLSGLDPDYIAIEPPELIGSGRAVSKARPELVSQTVSKLRRAGYDGMVLCGAGIVTGEDVAKAVELGAEGILVSSSVVRAKDWRAKIEELAYSLN